MRHPERLTSDDIQSLGASVVSQYETDTGTVMSRLSDDTAFGAFIFDNLKLVVTPNEANAYALGQAIKSYLRGEQ
jgi:hypothetical protein